MLLIKRQWCYSVQSFLVWSTPKLVFHTLFYSILKQDQIQPSGFGLIGMLVLHTPFYAGQWVKMNKSLFVVFSFSWWTQRPVEKTHGFRLATWPHWLHPCPLIIDYCDDRKKTSCQENKYFNYFHSVLNGFLWLVWMPFYQNSLSHAIALALLNCVPFNVRTPHWSSHLR